jgi:sulfopyruvate decarboxylase TPP-binding subunit
VSHVLTVPDTHQKTLLASLAQDAALELVTLATEDEAICVNAGLWMGGAEPLLIVQNVGLFAAMNALRGIAIDMRVPTCLVVGQYLRDVTKPAAENRASAVRYIEPMLASLGVPSYAIERQDDLPLLARAFAESRERRGPVVALIGAPTS